ncbi:MAG: flagellar export chaperone FliS [Oscillospiraceae bacterium]
MAVNSYQQFMQQSVSTMTPVQLLVALYDKAEQELKKAVYFIENNQIDRANNSIIKVQDIVGALDGSLKEKYEIAGYLASLYDYFAERLIEANIKKDAAILTELIPFFGELKDTFTEISKKGY